MFRSTVAKVIGGVALIVIVYMVGRRHAPIDSTAGATISHPAPNVTTIQVPVETLTPKVVEAYVAPANVAFTNALLAENKKLKVEVKELSVSLAASTSQGAGVATLTPMGPATIPTDSTTVAGVPEPAAYRLAFTDFRLDFLAEGAQVKYTLSQKFLILNTTGRNNKNSPTNLIRLYEIGPGETRTPMSVTETTTIVAAATPSRWYIKLGVQGGMGQVLDNTSDTSSLTMFLAVPWLKRGSNHSTENTRWAILTPVLAHSDTENSIGLLPISLNLGTIKSGKQPFTNLWISPYIGTVTGASLDRVGGLLSVTF